MTRRSEYTDNWGKQPSRHKEDGVQRPCGRPIVPVSDRHSCCQVNSNRMSDGLNMGEWKELELGSQHVFLDAGQVTEFLKATAFSFAKWRQYHQHDSHE